MKKCLILGNGKAPKKKFIEFFISKGFDTIICADGGANSIRKLGLVPHFIIGDFDSISKETLLFFEGKSTLIKLKRQNDTDVEKCLKFAIKKKINEAILFGVTGDRLDHTICNLGIVIKFFNKIKCFIAAEKSFLFPLNVSSEIKTIPDETISLYAFDSKTKITSRGLKYPIKNLSLRFGEKESTSNQALSNKIYLKISNGIVFVIRDLETIINNDLF